MGRAVTVTKEQIREKINASPSAVPDTEITQALAVASALVNEHLGEAASTIPREVVDRAVLLVAIEEINQDKAPNGVLNQTYDVGTGDVTSTPVRIGRDPMKPAYPILAPWVSGRFFCA